MFAGNYAPVDWAYCDGQPLQISQYATVYSIIGGIYGSDGARTFNLPDLKGRTPLGAGTGPGLSTYVIGQSGGAVGVAMMQNNLPAHSHSTTANNENASVRIPSQDRTSFFAKPNVTRGSSAQLKNMYSMPDAARQIAMNNNAIAVTGGGSSHFNRQPCMAVSFIFCMNGIFPTRD